MMHEKCFDAIVIIIIAIIAFILGYLIKLSPAILVILYIILIFLIFILIIVKFKPKDPEIIQYDTFSKKGVYITGFFSLILSVYLILVITTNFFFNSPELTKIFDQGIGLLGISFALFALFVTSYQFDKDYTKNSEKLDSILQIIEERKH